MGDLLLQQVLEVAMRVMGVNNGMAHLSEKESAKQQDVAGSSKAVCISQKPATANA